MKNYDDKINEIDLRLEGILGNIGKAIKGIGKGLSPSFVKHDPDENPQEPKSLSASKLIRDKDNLYDSVSEGDVYYIGENKILNIDKNMLTYFYFETNEEESERLGKLVKKSNEQKVLKLYPNLKWLFKGVYKAEKLSIIDSKFKNYSTFKGKMIRFEGIWESGTFSGVMVGSSEINGGQIIDGFYLAKAEGFKIDPWDFKRGGYSTHSSNFIFGKYPIAKENTKYKKLSLVQVMSGKVIKIIDNNDKEFVLNIQKGINYSSMDFKVNDKLLTWDTFNGNSEDFEKSFITIGKPFSIPGIIDIEKNIQSIEVKTLEYKPIEDNSTENNEQDEEKSIGSNKFDIKTKEKGWNPGGKGYYLLDYDINDNELSNSINKFKIDINSGKFFRYIKTFKQLIDEGRIDGYGNYPNLAFLFPKKQGVIFKTQDKNREALMKYFSNFREQVIDNFNSDNISKYYLNKIKNSIESKETNSKNKSKSKKDNKPTQSTSGVRPTEFGQINESNLKLSLKDIIKKII